MASYTISDIINNSAAAQQRRAEALRGLDLPEEGGVRAGVRPQGVPPSDGGGGGRPPGGVPGCALLAR